MKKLLILCWVLLAASIAAYAMQPDFAADPAISPDGSEVCFVFAGDLWSVPFKGGEAKRLTATESAEWGPCWSPDGNWIAFNSNREGSTYPYLIPAQGGAAKVVIEESYTVSDWYSDSANLLCTRYNLNYGSSFYKVPLDGTRPILMAEIGDRYATLSPDNMSIIFNRNGNPHRESYRGSLAGELWQIDIASNAYTRLTDTDFTERYPRFSNINNTLFFCASDGERFQVYSVDDLDFSNRTQITSLPLWSARDITVARKNNKLVFECFNEIWKYDPTKLIGDKVSKLAIDIDEDIWQQDIQREKMEDDFYNFAVSQDELLVGFQFKYDTFFMPRKGGEVKQVTHDLSSTGNMEFMDDGRTLLIQKLEQGRNKLFTVKCDSLMTMKPLDWFGKDSLDVEDIYKDPTGKWVIKYGDNRLSSRIAVADKDLTNIRPLKLDHPVVSNFAINSSGDYAVYATTREDVWTRELWLYDFAKDEHRKILNDDAWISSLTWTKDDKSILMTRSGDIYRLDLVPRDEFEFDEDNWKEIFAPAPDTTETEAESDSLNVDDLDTQTDAIEDSLQITEETAPEPPKELQIVWDGIDKRVFPILTDSDNSLSVQKAIDDSTFYYIAESNSGGPTAELKKANIYGRNSKQECVLGENTGNYRWIGDNIYYLQNGTIKYYKTEKGSDGEVKAAFDYDYSTSLLNTRVFEQVWGVFGLNFYDPNMHGKDWQKLYELYHPYAEKARSIDDIATIVNEMIGDVNASHTGFYPRRDDNKEYKQTAFLGLEFDYSIIFPEGICVKTIYPTSRLAAYYKMKAGDILTSIDGVKITTKTPLDSLLLDKVGKHIRLQYQSDGVVKDAIVTGLSWSENHKLFYTYQVERCKQTVNDLTNGRIGYVRIAAMGGEDFVNFQREVFRDNADKDALIIDVRGNPGGWIHDQIITLLIKKPYAYSTSRRYTGEKNLEPRRAWMRPTIVLADENSFSDGEIFPTVYQELKLGKVVGMPSSGSVIGTWEFDLLDGSSMRLPGSGWYKMDGTNMEGHGVIPDIIVENTPEDEIAGKDTQLLRAIEEIQKEIK